MKKNLIIGIVVISLAAASAVSFVMALKQKDEYTIKITESSKEKDMLDVQNKQINKLLSQKEKELDLARSQNFQQDMIAAQSALRQANEKLSQVIREKATLENTNSILDNRLKNTTLELTRTLVDLKNARESLAGIEGRHNIKIGQLGDNIKLKDAQIEKLQARISDTDDLSAGFKKLEREYSDALRKHQAEIAELQKDIASLNKSAAENEKRLASKDAELEKYKRQPAAQRAAHARALEMSDTDRFTLEKQIAESSARLFDQQEKLKNLEKKVSELKGALDEKEALLSTNEFELRERAKELSALRRDLKGLGAIPKTDVVISETQRELEDKVFRLEEEKRSLQDRLRSAQSKAAGRTGVKAEPEDLFADRNFRILTEALVRKEEQIKQMETELEAFRRDKTARESGSGLKEKRLAELEILVNTLTKQLGEYAGLIEQRERELKASNTKLASLMQEIEAHKVASIALQRELAEARNKQEKTFQSLTQIMSFNADAGVPEPEPSEAQVDTAGSGDVRKRAEEVRRRVEVLLEGKEK